MEGERKVFGGDCDVVHVNSDRGPPGFMLPDSVTIQSVHHGLECGRRISEAEEHYSGFIEPPLCFKRCFVFVSCLDANIVVPSSHVQFCVEHGSSQFSDQHGDEGEQVLVAHRPLVNISVILYRPQLPAFLFDEEEGQGIRGD